MTLFSYCPDCGARSDQSHYRGYGCGAEAVEPAPVSGWQPIETAPDDREWTPETPFEFPGGVAIAFDEETGEPLFLVYYRKVYGGCETTHWMPLPAPPAPTPPSVACVPSTNQEL